MTVTCPVQKNEAIAKALLTNGVNSNQSITGDNQRFASHVKLNVNVAVMNIISVFLVECGADTNNGYAPNYVAVVHDEANVLRMLLESGADDSAKSGVGETPLRCAVEGASLECVRILLAASGIEINSTDERERTPVDIIHYEIRRCHLYSEVRGIRSRLHKFQEILKLLQEKKRGGDYRE
jgi:hypothetical protein